MYSESGTPPTRVHLNKADVTVLVYLMPSFPIFLCTLDLATVAKYVEWYNISTNEKNSVLKRNFRNSYVKI